MDDSLNASDMVLRSVGVYRPQIGNVYRLESVFAYFSCIVLSISEVLHTI